MADSKQEHDDSTPGHPNTTFVGTDTAASKLAELRARPGMPRRTHAIREDMRLLDETSDAAGISDL